MDGITGMSSMTTPYSMIDQMTNNMIKGKDKNGDNALQADEFGGNLDVFNKIDQNHDSKLDVVELNNAKVLSEQTSNMVNALDTNGDHVLNADELKVSADSFNKIDTNGNGAADLTELNNAFIARKAANQYQQTMNSTNSTASTVSSSSIIA